LQAKNDYLFCTHKERDTLKSELAFQEILLCGAGNETPVCGVQKTLLSQLSKLQLDGLALVVLILKGTCLINGLLGLVAPYLPHRWFPSLSFSFLGVSTFVVSTTSKYNSLE
jgi:hypothetical protein